MRAWRMAPDGSAATRVTSDVVDRWRVTVSPDDKWIYYDTRGEPRRVSIDGGQHQPTFPPELIGRLTEPLPVGFHEATLSPDGNAIAGHYNTERGERIIVVPMGGGALRRYESVMPNATWAPDGRALVYYNTAAGVSNLMRQPLTGGPATPMTQFASEQIFSYALSPDQKHLAIVRGRVSSDVVLVSAAGK